MTYLARFVGIDPKKSAFDLIKVCVAKEVAADYVYKRGCLGKKVFNLTRLLAAMKGKLLK